MKEKRIYYNDGRRWKWFDDEIIGGGVSFPCKCGEKIETDYMNIYDPVTCPKCKREYKMAQTVWVYQSSEGTASE